MSPRRIDLDAIVPRPAELAGLRMFYSRAVEGNIAELLGAPHYSYRFAEAKFLALAQARGLDIAHLRMPEYYNSVAAFPPGAISADAQRLVHLIFRSTEQIRLLKPAYNICCFAWEFDVLKDKTGLDEHPFLNQKRMLSLCDEVWTPCSYTRDVLQAHGISNVHRVPAPIAPPPAADLSRADALAAIGQIDVVPFHTNFLLPHEHGRASSEGRITSLHDWIAPRLKRRPDLPVFLTVLNPEDFRKNLDALLRGFVWFQQEQPDAVLIVKALTSSTRFSLAELVSNVVPNKLASGSVFACDNIVFANAFLTDEQMSALYRLADFYVSTSVAEGQNLPLLEAMAHGTIPVTTRHTAMLDYTDSENAVVIDVRRVLNDSPHMAGTVAGKPFHIMRCGAREVCEALSRADALDAGQRHKMSAASARTVATQFSFDTVWELMMERLASLTPGAAAYA
jgi:glycosyltransferase involved in cell wall biosynthesis